MFGIDLGITVSSVTCTIDTDNPTIPPKYRTTPILDYYVLFGNTKNKNEWKRVIHMAEGIIDIISDMCRSHRGTYIAPRISIEEPVYPFRTRNPRSFFNLSCLYAIVRTKLEMKKFKIYSVNPVSVKATARAQAFKNKKLPLSLAVRGRLTKKGMVRAYKRIVGQLPPYSNNVGRETLADSFFIARTGMDRWRLGIK